MTEHIETPHKIKNFDAVAHDNMIRRMAHQVMQSNKSKLETVNAHVSEIKQKIKSHKIEQNQFKRTLNSINKLAKMARFSAENMAGC